MLLCFMSLQIRAKVNQDPIESEPGACATFESEQVSPISFSCNWRPVRTEISQVRNCRSLHFTSARSFFRNRKFCKCENHMSVLCALVCAVASNQNFIERLLNRFDRLLFKQVVDLITVICNLLN